MTEVKVREVWKLKKREGEYRNVPQDVNVVVTVRNRICNIVICSS